MAGISVVTEAARRALDVRDVKNYLKLDDDQDELMVRTLLSTASDYVENYIGKALINRTLKLSIDGLTELDYPLWEGTRNGPDIVYRQRVIQLPYGPVSSVTSIVTYDDNDNAVTFDSSKYYVDTVSDPARIILRNGETWPTALRVGNAIEITYVAGYGSSPAQIPEPIRLAMYQYIAFQYEHRGDVEPNVNVQMPSAIDILLQPYRTMNFSSNPFRGKDRT